MSSYRDLYFESSYSRLKNVRSAEGNKSSTRQSYRRPKVNSQLPWDFEHNDETIKQHSRVSIRKQLPTFESSDKSSVLTFEEYNIRKRRELNNENIPPKYEIPMFEEYDATHETTITKPQHTTPKKRSLSSKNSKEALEYARKKKEALERAKKLREERKQKLRDEPSDFGIPSQLPKVPKSTSRMDEPILPKSEKRTVSHNTNYHDIMKKVDKTLVRRASKSSIKSDKSEDEKVDTHSSKYSKVDEKTVKYDTAIRGYVSKERQMREKQKEVPTQEISKNKGFSKRIISSAQIKNNDSRARKENKVKTALDLIRRIPNYNMLKKDVSTHVRKEVVEKPKSRRTFNLTKKEDRTFNVLKKDDHVEILPKMEEEIIESPIEIKENVQRTKMVPKPSENTSDPPEHPTEVLNLVPCPICGRKFKDDRIKTHTEACKKANKKKRKPIDMKQKIVPLEAIKLKKEAEKKNPTPQKPKIPKWKIERQRLREALRANRMLKGEYVPPIPEDEMIPAETLDNRIECPHCGRKFSEQAATRHIPHCAKTIHKPSGPLKKGSGTAAGAIGALKKTTLKKPNKFRKTLR